MPARTAACRRRHHRTEWSAWTTAALTSAFPWRARSRRGGSRARHTSRVAREVWRVVSRLLLGGSLDRILDRVEGGEFNVVQFAAHLLNLAHVDVLDDIARLGIDLHRSA